MSVMHASRVTQLRHSHAFSPTVQRRADCHARHRRLSVSSSDSADVASANAIRRQQLKVELRQLATRLNQAPDRASLASLMVLVDALSAINPHPNSALSPLINGRWALLYTASGNASSSLASTSETSSTAKGTAGSSAEGSGSSGGSDGAGGLASALPFLQAVSDSVYQIFYRYVPILAGSAVGKASSQGPFVSRGNFQVFDTTRSYVLNQAKFTALGRPCEITVSGDVDVVLPAIAGSATTRFKATFREGAVVIGDGIAQSTIPIPIGWLSPVGYVDTPYLDEELRISRGDKGSIFIAVRCKEAADGS